MTRQSDNLQSSLFDDAVPRVELAVAQMTELTASVEALLREIAVALANGEIGDEQQDHG